MLQNKAYAAYANNKIMTASPAELTLMLYDGAIKFCNIAIMAVEKEDIQQAHTNIRKVERIIEEFQSTLDDKYPVSKDFNNVYTLLKSFDTGYLSSSVDWNSSMIRSTLRMFV